MKFKDISEPILFETDYILHEIVEELMDGNDSLLLRTLEDKNERNQVKQAADTLFQFVHQAMNNGAIEVE